MRSVFFFKPSRRLSRDVGSRRWWFKVWLPVVVALVIISAESTPTFSAQNTSSYLRPILERWFGLFENHTWESFHHSLRKSGHFIGYGGVGFTFLRAWLHTLTRRGIPTLISWRLESSILAILSTAIVASSDEFHQTFLPSRTGTPVDVLLDTCGAITVCLFVWLICWTKRTPDQLSL